jgi:DNA-nicking Smr family endonuclease
MSISDDHEEELSFAELFGEVKPISSDRVVQHKPKPCPTPRQSQRDEQKVMETLAVGPMDIEDMQPGDALSYVKPGIQKQVFKKLKRGLYSVGSELDLHGMNRIDAQTSLAVFITEARQQNIRCVRIIHGKGHGSSNQGPVIKPLVNTWLQRREDVLAFVSARPVDGGTGAVYVLLKSSY